MREWSKGWFNFGIGSRIERKKEERKESEQERGEGEQQTTKEKTNEKKQRTSWSINTLTCFFSHSDFSDFFDLNDFEMNENEKEDKLIERKKRIEMRWMKMKRLNKLVRNLNENENEIDEWEKRKKEKREMIDNEWMNEWTDKKVTSRQTDRWERMKEGWLRQAERNNKQDRLTNELKLTIEWEMKGKEERKGDWQEMMMMMNRQEREEMIERWLNWNLAK